MRYAEALEHNAASKRSAKSKKTLASVEIKKAENGGHIVTHRFESGEGPYHSPEEHVFGKGEGAEVIAHVAKHMDIPHDVTTKDRGIGEVPEEVDE